MAKKSSSLSPRIDAIRLESLTEGDNDALQDQTSFEGMRFDGAEVGGYDLSGITFMECELIELNAHETNLRGARFVESVLSRVNAPIFSAPRSSFRDVSITSSRLGSAEFYESHWQSVHISDSRLGYVNLRGAQLHDVLFSNCTIDELDLGGTTATRLSFENTQVASLDLTRATLKDVDLRALEFRALTGIEGLAGATVNSYQVTELAPLFASHFGITVDG